MCVCVCHYCVLNYCVDLNWAFNQQLHMLISVFCLLCIYVFCVSVQIFFIMCSLTFCGVGVFYVVTLIN